VVARAAAALTLIGLSLATLPAQSPVGEQPADLVLRGGKVIVLDAASRVTEAIAVRGNRILAVGSDVEMQRLIGPATRVMDLRGRGVTPGFIDAHTHTEHTAEFLRFWVDVHSPPLPSTRAIMDTVRERVMTVPSGTWVIGQGTFGQPMPSPDELTGAFPDHPVVLRWSRHDYVVNKKALEVSGITRATPDPQGGRIERGPDGEPTGRLQESFDLLKIPAYPPNELKAAIEETLREQYLKQGVTSVYDMPGNQAIPQYWALHDEGKLAVRLRLTYTMWPGSQSQMDLDSFLKSGLRPGMGDEWLKVGSVKLFIDGVGDNLKTPSPTLLSHVKRIHAAGFQVLMHATSPRAQDMALDAIEAAQNDTPRPDARPRIEHLGGRLDEPRLARAKRLGAIIVPTPGGIQGGGGGGQAASGPARNPYRSLLGMGFRPPGNSDTAGTRTDMINPMRNVYLLVTRVTNRGIVSHPDEALSVMDALRVYTTFSAYASFEEQIKGTLEPGKLADLVVLSEDPLTIPPARLKDVKVDATIIDGKIAYQRSGDASHEQR
jgi:predicted amidohydrolase YtcJ